MQQVAEADHFRHIFFGLPSIGGRYSALSNFGVVPGGFMGLDMNRFLGRTQEMVEACGASVPVDQNPGVVLGIILGTAARNGRDKVTILTSPGISALGAWLEQLLAESTGKQGKGIVPVDREDVGRTERLRQRSRVRLRAPRIPIRTRHRKPRSPRSSKPGIRSCASLFRTFTIWARNFSAGKSPPPWPDRSSESTRSTSPTSKPARLRRAI